MAVGAQSRCAGQKAAKDESLSASCGRRRQARTYGSAMPRSAGAFRGNARSVGGVTGPRSWYAACGAAIRGRRGANVCASLLAVTLAVTPVAGAETQVAMSGVLQSQDGKYFLTDAITSAKVELVGANLAQYAGQCVRIAGSSSPGAPTVAGASPVVAVAAIKSVSCASARKIVAAGSSRAGGGHRFFCKENGMVIGSAVFVGVMVGLIKAGAFSHGNLAIKGRFSL